MRRRLPVDVLPGDRHHRERVSVNGTEMSFVDVGEGDPVVFLHGNPTWSYLWRNVIPYLADRRRCLAPDLVGMGQSGPAPDGRYSFVDQAGYVDGWFDAVVPEEPVVLVVHDWGSALGFWWAFRHQQRVAAIAYMEAMVQPRNWSDFPEDRRGPFQRLRSPEGDRLVFEDNFFVETVLPMSIIRTLTEPEMEAYRAPFRDPASRTPTLVWPREIPVEGEPRDVFEIFEQYGAWLSKSTLPKLMIKAEPGAILIGRLYNFCRSWPNQRESTVRGIHFIQEDSPDEIGVALREFVAALPEQKPAPVRR
jgi:haloalkane dehalogenase